MTDRRRGMPQSEEEEQSAASVMVPATYRTYNAAARGLRNYWYPVAFAKDLQRKKGMAVTLCGDRIAVFRDDRTGQVKALHDRCPHRGIPLSEGQRWFPGHVTCIYHGWTYDLESGELKAALTDGPNSPICGKASVRVRSYPCKERAGLIWIYPGELEPAPVEYDIPEELLRPDAVIRGQIRDRRGNWRFAIENAVDEGHSKALHRKARFQWFRRAPGWVRSVEMRPSEDGLWLERIRGEAVMQDEYPGLGKWPRDSYPWESNKRGPSGLAVRLPALCRVLHGGFTDYQWFVPIDEGHFRLVVLAVTWGGRLRRMTFPLRYRSYIRPFYQGELLAEDQWMIELMEIPPERLYRPDVSITGWRRWLERTARGIGSNRPSESGDARRGGEQSVGETEPASAVDPQPRGGPARTER